jgi:hypothetical protein
MVLRLPKILGWIKFDPCCESAMRAEGLFQVEAVK